MNRQSIRLTKCISILIALLILNIPIHVQAQRYVMAEGNVNLRDAPPHGLFYKFGNIVDVVKEGETLRVLEEKTIIGVYIWLKVERINAPSTGANVGWVYNGENDGRPYFKPIEAP